MTALFKILGFVAITLIVAVVLKPYRPEYVTVIATVSVIVCVIFALNIVCEPVKTIIEKAESFGVQSEYLKTLLKVLLVAYISGAAANICRDNGQSALAFSAETVGKGIIFVLCIPLFSEIITSASEFLKL